MQERMVGATLRVTRRAEGSSSGSRCGSCRVFDGVTEANFDTRSLSEADSRSIVAGNVIHVTRVLIRLSGASPANLSIYDGHNQFVSESRVALLRISLVSGKPDEPCAADDLNFSMNAPKAPPLPALAPGNVDALCSGSGKDVLVRVLDTRREPGTSRRAPRTGGASSSRTGPPPRVASRPAVLMPAASRRSPCVSSRRWAARHTTARRPSCSSRSRSWLRHRRAPQWRRPSPALRATIPTTIAPRPRRHRQKGA